MRKQERRSSLLVLVIAVFVLYVSLVTSCTRDEFFQIEKDYEGVDYHMLKKIALSKEYIEFQRQSFLSTKEIFNIDTTQKVVVDYYEGKPVYVIGQEGSIGLLLEAKQRLLESYPEYANTTMYEKNQIINIALINDKSLMQLVEEKMVGTVKRTKSVDYETAAVLYLKRGGELIDDNKSEWLVVDNDGGTYTFYSNPDWNMCISDAISKTESNGKEHGGYAWEYDGSGVTIVDHNATSNEMNFPHWLDSYAESSPQLFPILDFHIHPSGNLAASPEDYKAWNNLPWRVHMIFNCSGSYWVYGW